MLLERVGRRKAALRTPDVWLNQPTTQRNTYPEAAWHIYENPENPEAIRSDGSFISEGAVARDFTSS